MQHKQVSKHYDTIDKKVGNEYEHDRWFRDAIRSTHYEMTRNVIKEALERVKFTSCFELGPGAGTWTRILQTHMPTATYMLLDISETMLNMARQNLKNTDAKIDYVASDILLYQPKSQFDFFFSSRALEYVDDKQALIEKIDKLLLSKGEGFIITKYPRYWAYRLMRRPVPELHSGQVSPGKLVKLLQKQGFSIQTIRPATITIPFCKSATINKLAFNLLKLFWFAPVHGLFSESYFIHFKKSS